MREALVAHYARCSSVHLRKIVAKHLITVDRIEEGLRLMANILADVGTDHTTTDSIAMSMTCSGTPEIKQAFLYEAARSPDNELKGNLEWTAGLMYDERPEPYHPTGLPEPTIEGLLRDLDELVHSFAERTYDRRFYSSCYVQLTGHRAHELSCSALRQLHDSFKIMKHAELSEKQDRLWHQVQQAAAALLDKWPS